MKISVFLARYTITGVPLAQVRFARALAARGHEVELIIGYVDSQYTKPLVEGVKVCVWSYASVRRMLFPLMSYLRKEKPDVIFSAEDHLNNIVLLAAVLTRSKAKISGSSRVTPFDTYSIVPFSKRWVLKQFTRALMWRANALTCVSQDMVKQYQQIFDSSPHVCVYNIIDEGSSRYRMEESVEHPWVNDKTVPLLVAAGRLAPWKGFGDLIRSVKIVSARRPVRLIILGDGPLRMELDQQIAGNGLSDCIQLLGYVENPLKYFNHANAFVLSSLVEGMPNVLVEAMMCGCTPVSTNCPTGPSELLQSGKYGYLVPVGDIETMANAIETAIDNPIPNNLLAEAVKPFEEHTVIKRHFEMLGL